MAIVEDVEHASTHRGQLGVELVPVLSTYCLVIVCPLLSTAIAIPVNEDCLP